MVSGSQTYYLSIACPMHYLYTTMSHRCRFAGVSYFCQSRTHTWMTLTLTLPETLARNTPWVDMSACVKFRLDRPSRLAGHTEHRSWHTDKQTDKHIAFYYIDAILVACHTACRFWHNTCMCILWMIVPYSLWKRLLTVSSGDWNHNVAIVLDFPSPQRIYTDGPSLNDKMAKNVKYVKWKHKAKLTTWMFMTHSQLR